MIVDDEKRVLEEVKNILEQDNFNVFTAENSRKAFEIMDTHKENDFGLILIKSLIPNTGEPAFFSMKPSEKKDIDTTKIDDFLQRPFTREELVDFVKKKL
jgi:DNA-binding response OmpR family regulator